MLIYRICTYICYSHLRFNNELFFCMTNINYKFLISIKNYFKNYPNNNNEKSQRTKELIICDDEWMKESLVLQSLTLDLFFVTFAD